MNRIIVSAIYAFIATTAISNTYAMKRSLDESKKENIVITFSDGQTKSYGLDQIQASLTLKTMIQDLGNEIALHNINLDSFEVVLSCLEDMKQPDVNVINRYLERRFGQPNPTPMQSHEAIQELLATTTHLDIQPLIELCQKAQVPTLKSIIFSNILNDRSLVEAYCFLVEKKFPQDILNAFKQAYFKQKIKLSSLSNAARSLIDFCKSLTEKEFSLITSEEEIAQYIVPIIKTVNNATLETLLHTAIAMKADPRVLRIILKAAQYQSFDLISIKTWANQTALHLAVAANHAPTVLELITTHGINPQQLASIKDHSNSTALLKAAQLGHATIIKVMLSAPGINTQELASIPNNADVSPLNSAVYNGHTACITELLSAPGINAQKLALQKGPWGHTALHAAVWKNNIEAVKAILKAPGINAYELIMAEDAGGNTPLDDAAQDDNKRAITDLLLSYVNQAENYQ